MPEDLRTISMFDWLENDLLFTIAACAPASSDASFRRYFRVRTSGGCMDAGGIAPDQLSEQSLATAGQQFIVMDAPPAKENIEPFIRIAKLLTQHQINVPTIFQQNLPDGFLLLEDFGNQCFLDQLNETTVDELYQTALDSLFKLQTQVSVQSAGLPSYDEALLHRELAIFDEWFLTQLLDIQTPTPVWETVRTLLTASALEQPRAFIHRDYHSRNL
ncbi:MAG: aminoglycoside phosphotransferase family protein, partial [Methylobacter sp.]